MNSIPSKTVESYSNVQTGDFRRVIAQRCANMLYGNHTRKMDLVIEIRPVLAGIPFISCLDQLDLAMQVCAQLNGLLGKKISINSIRVTIILRETRDSRNRLKCEEYLRIKAHINHQ